MPILKDMALTQAQKAIIDALAASPLKEKFYWTGGTLLAEKYLHHRASYDVDLFSDAPVKSEEIKPMIDALKQTLRLAVVDAVRVHDRWEFFIHNHDEVRLEFVHYDYPALKPRRMWRGVRIDSLEDLAANKTMALVERHEPKDAVDIYFLMTRGKIPAHRLLLLARKKFGFQMNTTTFLSEALRAAKAIPEIRAMLHGTPVQQTRTLQKIQEFFERISREFLRRNFAHFG